MIHHHRSLLVLANLLWCDEHTYRYYTQRTPGLYLLNFKREVDRDMSFVEIAVARLRRRLLFGALTEHPNQYVVLRPSTMSMIGPRQRQFNNILLSP